MERFTLIHKDGSKLDLVSASPYRMVTEAKLSQEWMGADELHINIQSEEIIAFELGDVVMINGVPYALNAWVDTNILAEDRYEYTAVLSGIMYDANRCLFRNTDEDGHGDSNEFYLTYTLEDFAKIIVNNLNRVIPALDKVHEDGSYLATEDEREVQSESNNTVSLAQEYVTNKAWVLEMHTDEMDSTKVEEVKTLQFSSQTTLAALQTICQEYDCDWWTSYNGTHKIMHIGKKVSAVELPTDNNALSLGVNKGLCSIKESAQGEKRYISKLWVTGGTENILASYRDYSAKLMLPCPRRLNQHKHTLKDGTVINRGTMEIGSDNPKDSFLIVGTDIPSVDRFRNFGEYEGSINLQDIYPTLTCSVSRIYASQDDIEITPGRIDTDFVINFDPVLRPFGIDAIETKFRYPELYFDSVDIPFNLNRKWYESWPASEGGFDSGVNIGKYQYWCYVNGVKYIAQDFNNALELCKQFNDISSNPTTRQWQDWFKNDPSHPSADYPEIYAFVKLVANSNNTVYLIPGKSAQITFVTGTLAGVTFNIAQYKEYTKNGVSHKRFMINRVEDDTQTLFPSKDDDTFRVVAGDKFKITNICFPISILQEAEENLYFAALDEFKDLCRIPVSYDVQLDPIYLHHSFGDKMYKECPFEIGSKVRVVQPQLSLDSNLLIKKVERDLLNPFSVSLTLEEAYRRPQWAVRFRNQQVYEQQIDLDMAKIGGGITTKSNKANAQIVGRSVSSNNSFNEQHSMYDVQVEHSELIDCNGKHISKIVETVNENLSILTWTIKQELGVPLRDCSKGGQCVEYDSLPEITL